MASLTVRAGLNPNRVLSQTQMVVVMGKQNLIKNVAFEGPLSGKLAPFVTQESFQQAVQQLEKPGSMPLYLNLAKIVSVASEVSRHNSSANPVGLYKAALGISPAPKVEQLSIVLYADYSDVVASVAAVARAFSLYSAKTAEKPALKDIEIEVVVPNGEGKLGETDVGFLQTLADNIRQCARLVDIPANILHTDAFVDEAQAMVQKLGAGKVQTTIIKGEELLEKGFEGIYSVGKAAAHGPIFACFSYTPAGATESIALVGKGICFDTGGFSLKPRTAMPTMKIDMGGAATVLSTFCTLIQTGFKQALHCLLCVAENSVSPVANKPDDVITMLSGKTVEITNTDAEGRLVLGDGVYYAKTTLKATTIIDCATLTGAQAIATGKFHAAILANSDRLEQEAIKWGRRTGDLVHPLPYCPDLHFPVLKSEVADMVNAKLSGTMDGPPSAVAGLFVGAQMDFGKDIDWLHCDIAYPVTNSSDRGTGFGVAFLTGLLGGKHTDVDLLRQLEGTQ